MQMNGGRITPKGFRQPLPSESPQKATTDRLTSPLRSPRIRIVTLPDKLAILHAIQRLRKQFPDDTDVKRVCDAAELIVHSPVYFS